MRRSGRATSLRDIDTAKFIFDVTHEGKDYSPQPTLVTPLTEALGVKHPVMLAGMDTTSGSEMVAAVANAGGFGCLGGVRYTPKVLREMIEETKAKFDDPDTPFGVDLLLPQVGGGARKTNTDYTRGNLDELLDVVIEGGTKLFVSAVGVPPKWAVDKLHDAGVLYANVIGHPKVGLVISLQSTSLPLSHVSWSPAVCSLNLSMYTKPVLWAPTSSLLRAARLAATPGTFRSASCFLPAPTSARTTRLLCSTTR